MEANNQNERPQSSNDDIYINGRGQIVDMLKVMPLREKERLLRHLSIRNPSVAQELSAESLSFGHLQYLRDSQLVILEDYVKASFMGIAMKNIDVPFQKKILAIVSRNYAEEAFRYLKAPLKNENQNCKRAQTKIISIVSRLIQKGIISL